MTVPVQNCYWIIVHQRVGWGDVQVDNMPLLYVQLRNLILVCGFKLHEDMIMMDASSTKNSKITLDFLPISTIELA